MDHVSSQKSIPNCFRRTIHDGTEGAGNNHFLNASLDGGLEDVAGAADSTL